MTKLSDPRIDPARTTITKVAVTDDLASARVYVSVIGSQADQRKALAALKHAAGHLQELMMREVSLRQTPVLNFVLDTDFKRTLETMGIIDQAMAEIQCREQDKQPDADSNQASTQDDA